MDGSPAAQAGLRPEDLILSVNDERVERVEDLLRLMGGELIGERVRLELVREGEARAVEVVPIELAA